MEPPLEFLNTCGMAYSGQVGALADSVRGSFFLDKSADSLFENTRVFFHVRGRFHGSKKTIHGHCLKLYKRKF